MENILKPETLSLFLYFVVPGFVTLQVYDVIVPAERRNFGESLIQLVSYSLITRALLFWAFPFVDAISTPKFRAVNPAVYFLGNGAFLLLALAIIPVLLALGVYALRVTGRRPINHLLKLLHLEIAILDRTPTAWDKFFGRNEPCIVVFHMNEGDDIIGGFSTHSFASAYPAPNQIYVEQVLTVDQATGQYQRKANSKGVIINIDVCHWGENSPPGCGGSLVKAVGTLVGRVDMHPSQGLRAICRGRQ